MVQKTDPLPGSGLPRESVNSPSPAGSNYTTASESGGVDALAEEPSPDDLTVHYGQGEVSKK